ncbi:MAG: D-tyrosyl-tRNA(Tyr) deacylase [Thermoflexales bacterium]|nr:D-tyrosyl-tRNA(Tyr) deacylase [Thermoflexales bacterium]
MRALVQRVTHADVRVEACVVGAIERGLVVLVGATHSDAPAQAQVLANKVANLRIFDDEAGKMNLSALDVGAGMLVVSQFTLYANCRRGRRPDFIAAARPELAEPLIEQFVQALRQTGIARIEQGVFGALMTVNIHNDGPVTIMLDTGELFLNGVP